MEIIKPKTSQATNDMPVSKCPGCHEHNPHTRSRHHLAYVSQHGLDTLRSHLTIEYGGKASEYGQDGRDTVHSICAWVGNLASLYAGIPDDITGEPLPWLVARDRMMAARETIAQAASQRKDT